MSTLSPTDFRTVFQTCRDNWKILLELSRRQMELIGADDYTQLLAVFGQKQRIIGRLDEVKRRYPNLRKQWHARRAKAEDALRNDCDRLLAETEAILAELLKEEQTSTQHLAGRRAATQRELQAISKGSEVHQAYRDGLAPATHRHLNIDQ